MLAYANHFLAGALTTLLIPAAALVAIVAWYTYAVLRMAATRPEGTPEVPGPTPPASSGLRADERADERPPR